MNLPTRFHEDPEFFDLDRGLLIQADHLSDARRIERLFISTFAEHRAPAPLVVRKVAAGHTEWFRGVASSVDVLARELCADRGFVLHAPLSSWLRERFVERSTLLYGWSARMLEALEYEYFNVPALSRNGYGEKALRDALDACAALGMEIRTLVPGQVLDWYHSDDYFGAR